MEIWVGVPVMLTIRSCGADGSGSAMLMNVPEFFLISAIIVPPRPITEPAQTVGITIFSVFESAIAPPGAPP